MRELPYRRPRLLATTTAAHFRRLSVAGPTCRLSAWLSAGSRLVISASRGWNSHQTGLKFKPSPKARGGGVRSFLAQRDASPCRRPEPYPGWICCQVVGSREPRAEPKRSDVSPIAVGARRVRRARGRCCRSRFWERRGGRQPCLRVSEAPLRTRARQAPTRMPFRLARRASPLPWSSTWLSRSRRAPRRRGSRAIRAAQISRRRTFRPVTVRR
jgi:hypothetical protein